MKKMIQGVSRALVLVFLTGCSGAIVAGDVDDTTTPVEEGAQVTRDVDQATSSRTFGEDLTFLREHTEIIVLSDPNGAAEVAVAPEYQGRVMTSSSSGAGGTSYGWINRDRIEAADRQPHMNVYGGEDRFWLGPEGGQYSLYFAADSPFDLEHWQVPEPIDWGGWEVTVRSRQRVSFQRDMELTNFSGARFELQVDRTVRLLEHSEIEDHIGVELEPTVRVVAFESINVVTNRGDSPWRRETGLLSIWILGMFTPTTQTTVVIPFRPGPEAADALGPIVNDAYFGQVPSERLLIEDDVLFFRGDGQYRSKIGIPPPRARSVLGSYDADQGVLTLVQFTLPQDATEYVNSMWELQERPYGGDVVNSYNDGPPEPGASPLGPFYELESSSPAAALAPGEQITHVHRTIHLQGPEGALDGAAMENLGVGLAHIRAALERKRLVLRSRRLESSSLDFEQALELWSHVSGAPSHHVDIRCGVELAREVAMAAEHGEMAGGICSHELENDVANNGTRIEGELIVARRAIEGPHRPQQRWNVGEKDDPS